MEITHQRLSSEASELTKQQIEHSQNISTHISELQKAYRTELDRGEFQMWLRGLAGIPINEIMAATENLLLHPPKFEIDGEIQVWRGMPKLPDILQKVTELREHRASMLRANPPKYPDCKDCDSTGWIQVQEESRTHPGKMVMKSVRCVCRKNFVLTAE